MLLFAKKSCEKNPSGILLMPHLLIMEEPMLQIFHLQVLGLRIAFSNAGIRGIHLIPVVNKSSGKLLLVEKHPFRGQRGVVIAVAPLAGLNPKIDQDHPTLLHLRIREFDPRSTARKPGDFSSKVPSHTADGR